jgi:hypothetical protein
MSEHSNGVFSSGDFRDKIDPLVLEQAYTEKAWREAMSAFDQDAKAATQVEVYAAALNLTRAREAALNELIRRSQDLEAPDLLIDDNLMAAYVEYIQTLGTQEDALALEELLILKEKLIPGEVVLRYDTDLQPVRMADATIPQLFISTSKGSAMNIRPRVDWEVLVEGDSLPDEDKTVIVDTESFIGREAVLAALEKQENEAIDYVEQAKTLVAAYEDLGDTERAESFKQDVASRIYDDIRRDGRIGRHELLDSLLLLKSYSPGSFEDLKDTFATDIAADEVPSTKVTTFFIELARLHKGEEGESDMSARDLFAQAVPLMLEAYDRGSILLEEKRVQASLSSRRR